MNTPQTLPARRDGDRRALLAALVAIAIRLSSQQRREAA
jgi:hypothetical protein